MVKRPGSITIISWIFIALGTFSLFWDFLPLFHISSLQNNLQFNPIEFSEMVATHLIALTLWNIYSIWI